MEKGMGGDGFGLKLEAHGEGRDGLKDGKGRTPLAMRRQVADSNLSTVP